MTFSLLFYRINTYIAAATQPKAMDTLLLSTTLLFTIFTIAFAGNHTVTDEAWFDVEVKDMDGPGQDYRGRFVVALFGESAPMTTMNFVAITRGYKRGKVCVFEIFM